MYIITGNHPFHDGAHIEINIQYNYIQMHQIYRITPEAYHLIMNLLNKVPHEIIFIFHIILVFIQKISNIIVCHLFIYMQFKCSSSTVNLRCRLIHVCWDVICSYNWSCHWYLAWKTSFCENPKTKMLQ